VPLYEYQCKTCESRFEQLVVNDKADVACRICGSPEVDRVLSTFAVVGEGGRAREAQGPCASCGAAQRGMCAMN